MPAPDSSLISACYNIKHLIATSKLRAEPHESKVHYRDKDQVLRSSGILEVSLLKRKKVSPHSLWHSAAMGLLQHGVDRSVMTLWLGHESVETTNRCISFRPFVSEAIEKIYSQKWEISVKTG